MRVLPQAKNSQLKYVIAAWLIVRRDLHKGKLIAYRLGEGDRSKPIKPILWTFLNLDIETSLFKGSQHKNSHGLQRIN